MERLRCLFIHQNFCTVLLHHENPVVSTMAHSLPHGVSVLLGDRYLFFDYDYHRETSAGTRKEWRCLETRIKQT